MSLQSKVAAKREKALILRNIKSVLPGYELQQVMSLLQLLSTEAQADLVDVKPQDFLQKQAEAKTYRDLINMLLDERPSIEAPQE